MSIIILAALAATTAFALVATVIVVSRDGYRRVPTRQA